MNVIQKSEDMCCTQWLHLSGFRKRSSTPALLSLCFCGRNIPLMETRWSSHCQTEGHPCTRRLKEMLLISTLHLLYKLGNLLSSSLHAQGWEVWHLTLSRLPPTLRHAKATVRLRTKGGEKHSFRDMPFKQKFPAWASTQKRQVLPQRKLGNHC